jgi:hypothetical protein
MTAVLGGFTCWSESQVQSKSICFAFVLLDKLDGIMELENKTAGRERESEKAIRDLQQLNFRKRKREASQSKTMSGSALT